MQLRQHADALRDFSRAETIVREAPPQPTDVGEIRVLPGMTYANLARAAAAMAQAGSTPAHLRGKYAKDAREWSQRAAEWLQPLTIDVLEGREAKRLLAEMEAALRPLPLPAGP